MKDCIFIWTFMYNVVCMRFFFYIFVALMFIFLSLYLGYVRKLEKVSFKHTTSNALHFHVYF